LRQEERENFATRHQSALDFSRYAFTSASTTNRTDTKIEFSQQPTCSTGAIPKRPQSSQYKQTFGGEPSEATVQHTPSWKEQRGKQAKNEAESDMKNRLVNRNIHLKFCYI
jgi:hypothetical protein